LPISARTRSWNKRTAAGLIPRATLAPGEKIIVESSHRRARPHRGQNGARGTWPRAGIDLNALNDDTLSVDEYVYGMSKVIPILVVALLWVSVFPAWADFFGDYALKSCLDQCNANFSRLFEPSLNAQCAVACKTKHQPDRSRDLSGPWNNKDKRKGN